MKSEKLIFKTADGSELPAYIWTPEKDALALLQISHGMTEHMGRYEAMAEKLCSEGIAVAGFDLKGHGKNPGESKCASFGENGWDKSVQDIHFFYEFLRLRFENIPHVMLGFSLGSFLLRDYLNKYDDKLWGAIIMGTGCQMGFVLSILKKLVWGQAEKFGFNNSSALVRKLSFETYNARFKPNRTASDWLCSDEKELDSYIEDPLCRKEISTGLFWQMLDSMQRTGGKTAYDRWNRDMPVLLLSGDDDPVGDMGKGVRKLLDKMRKAGIKNAELRLFDGARHDLLHEVESGTEQNVIGIIINFIKR